MYNHRGISNTISVNFRVLQPSDAAAYWALRLEALETEPDAFGKDPAEFRAISVGEMSQKLRDMGDGSFTLGAFENDSLIGIATFLRDTRVKEKHKAHIVGVFVKATYRGRGAGRALLLAMLERARSQQGLDHVLLAVATTNIHAFHLYCSLGFVTWGTEPRALLSNGRFVEEHHMILQLR